MNCEQISKVNENEKHNYSMIIIVKEGFLHIKRMKFVTDYLAVRVLDSLTYTSRIKYLNSVKRNESLNLSLIIKSILLQDELKTF